MAFTYAIVLTGGIATGKSTVAEVFKSYGWHIIDADKIAHVILDAQSKEIAEIFGDEYVTHHKVDRKKLGTLIFNHKQKKETLEGLLHPLIYQEIERLANKEEAFKKPYLIDIPLFFETKRYPIEKSLLVYASKDVQLKRLMYRDGYSSEEALSRIASQIDIEQKYKMATYTIVNMDDLDVLRERCKKAKDEILGDF